MKYPHTPILPWSPNHLYDTDDEFHQDVKCFENKNLIYTEKLDGECTVCTKTIIHARSEDGYGKPWQHYMKRFYSNFCYNIPEGMQICGECVYAVHSIEYSKLPSCFFVFAIIVDGTSLSWKEVEEWSLMLGLDTVPLINDAPNKIVDIPIPKQSTFGDICEGYVIRNSDSFSMTEISLNIGKSVRKDHVKTDIHWTNTWRPTKFIEEPIERLLRKRL